MASGDPSLGPHSASSGQGRGHSPYLSQGLGHGQPGMGGQVQGQGHHHVFYSTPVSASPHSMGSTSRGGPHDHGHAHGPISIGSPTAVLGAGAGGTGGPAPGRLGYGPGQSHASHASQGILLGSASLAGGEAIAAHHHHLQQQQQHQQQQQQQQGHRQPLPTGAPASAAAAASSSPSSAASAAGGIPKPIRRRMRMITSCLECRRRKLKCNKSAPCTNCLRFSRDCMYLGPKLDEASQLRLTEIKEKVGSLERQLERDVAKSTASRGFYQQRIVADDVEDEYDEERDLEITPMVALDLTYDDPEVDSTDDIIDLGIQVGRMRITERIGGLNRPRISDEIKAGLSGGRPGQQTSPPPGGPPGLSPPHQASAQLGGHPNASRGVGVPGVPTDAMSDAAGSDVSIPDFLRPGASYIPPTSGFFFGQVVQSPSLLNFLPKWESGDRLMQRYFEAVHPIARCVHRPSFEIQYASFWNDVRQGFEPRASVQAVVFAAWFSAAVSMDEALVAREFGLTKASLMENMKIGTEAALSKANFLRTTRVETMQAFVMYMIPLCRAEVSRAHSVLVGAAVRMAECMGLHRDGEAYGLTPLETHMRRLIWHQLCFLDVRTCEAQGPKPAIRREDYDTKLPLNCEEDELTHADVPPEPAERWTSTLLPLMRFEINEMMRIIWMDRRKLENRKTTLTAVLTKIENFRKRMLEKYDRFLDDSVPIQRYAKLVMHLLMYRLHAMVLHPYHSNTANPMPQRLNSVLIYSGIMIIELSMQLETQPIFASWSWYLGAYQQFQIALLLATEIYYRPQNKEVDRIWNCLDYVFGLDRNTPREEKSARILHEIMGKTAVYMGMRKMRAPTGIAKAVPDKQAVKTEGAGAAAAMAGGGSGGDMPPPPPPPRGGGEQQQQPQQLSPGASGAAAGGYQPRPQPQMPSPTSLKAEPGPQQGMMHHHHHHHHHHPAAAAAAAAAMSTGPPPPPSSMAGMQHPHPQMQGPPPQGPPPQMTNFVFGGVSNGEVLWGLPPQNPNSPDAGSSDGGSVAGGHSQRHGSVAGMHGGGGPMDPVDWSVYDNDAINAIFPPNPQTGEFNMTSFVNPNIGTKWN